MYRIRHFRTSDGGFTIVYDPKDLEYGYSFCSRKDQFSRKLGRMIAQERLDTGSEYPEVVDDRESDVSDILQDILRKNLAPDFARDDVKMAIFMEWMK